MPEWTGELRARLARLSLSPTREAEIVEELSQHLDDRCEELVHDGTAPDAARRLALAELDEVSDRDLLARRMAPLRQAHVQEQLPPGAPAGRRLLGDLWHDVRYAARMLLRQRAFTVAAVATLALGIGANTAIFSLVNATLFQHLPVRDADQLFFARYDEPGGVFSYPAYADLRDRNDAFEGLIAWGGITASLNTDGETDLINGAIVTGNYFDLLGVAVERGRLINLSDDVTPMGHPVAVISEGLWDRRFSRRDYIVGHSILLNGQPFTIIGVVGRAFPGAQIGVTRDLYVPMMMQPLMRPPRAGYSGDMNPDLLNNRGNGWLYAVGRLKSGVTVEQAQTSLSALANQFVQAQQPPPPPTARPRRIVVTSLEVGDPNQRAQMVSVAQLLMAVVGAVLLIACANVANLLLSRAASRQREIALRLALGASRWRLIRQLLTESVLLALAGGVAGVAVAWGVVRAFRAAPPPPGALPIAIDFVIDQRVLLFAIGLSVLTGIVFGLLPAWKASRPSLVPALKDGPETAAATGDRPSRLGLKRGLVVTQVALSLTLLVAAGLFVRSLGAARAVDPGFDVDRLISAPLNVNLLRYTRAQGREFYGRVIDSLRSQPGVQDAAVARVAVVTGGGRIMSVRVEGRSGPDGRFVSEGGGATADGTTSVAANVVSAGFFDTLGIPLVKGRGFAAADHETAPGVVVVSETMARMYFPGEDPIGRRVNFRAGQGPWLEIVGLVRDSAYARIGEAPTPVVYLPLSQNHETGVTLYVRTAAEPATLAATVRQTIRSLEPNLPVPDVTPLTSTLGASLYASRMGAILLTGFGVLALLLAVVGIYGVLAFSMVQRTRELSVRVALGATAANLFSMVVREGLVLVSIGLALGLAFSAYGSRWLRGFLFGISTTDAGTFVVVSLVLMGVALLACVVPALRASRVDPMGALRG